MKYKKYRIVRDSYNGYECQSWIWCWPFWRQMNFSNTHPTIERAEQYIKDFSQPIVKYVEV